MRGSVAATMVVLFAGVAAAAVLLSVRHANKMSQRVVTFEQVRGENIERQANEARLEGENARLRAENATLKELATGRKDIADLTQEIRTMVWMAYGPNEEGGSRARRAPRDLRDPTDA